MLPLVSAPAGLRAPAGHGKRQLACAVDPSVKRMRENLSELGPPLRCLWFLGLLREVARGASGCCMVGGIKVWMRSHVHACTGDGLHFLHARDGSQCRGPGTAAHDAAAIRARDTLLVSSDV